MVTCRTDRKSVLLAPTMVDLATLYYHPNQHSENTLVLLFGID